MGSTNKGVRVTGSPLRLRGRFQFATVCYCAAIFMVFGFVALTVASNMNSVLNGNTNLYLRVWGESMMMVVLSIALFFVAFLVSSSKVDRLTVGGILGVGFSVIGAIVAMDLLNVIAAYDASLSIGPGQFFEAMLVVCFVAVLLVGFPLGMIGSLGGLRNGQSVSDSTNSEDAATG